MTARNKTLLKTFFNTGDIPTEVQFADFIDSLQPRGFTFLVAASNATAAEIAQADYVCDGMDDQVQIQAAIDALPVAGGTVRLSAGLFTIADAGSGYCLYIARSNMHISIPVGCTIKLKDNEIAGVQICNLFRIGDGAAIYSNILLDGGGTIDGNEDNNVSTGNITTGADIYLNGPVTNVKLSNLILSNASRDAVFIYGTNTANRANNITVENCTINNPAEGIVWGNADNVWVVNNKITNTREQDGVESIDNCSGWWICNNKFSGINSSNGAIDIFSNATLNTHGIISGNIVANNGAQYDISIGLATTGPISDVILQDNIVINGGVLVGEGAGVGGTCSAIRMVDNILIGGGALTTGYGLWMGAYASGVSIVGNNVYGFRFAGLNVLCANAEIRNNKIYNNGQNVLAADTDRVGIKIAGATGSMVVGNYIYDDQIAPTQTYPVNANFSTNALISDNYFGTHSISTAVLLAGATGQAVRRNAGLVTENQGAAAAISDGGTIDHGCYTTPTVAILSASVAGEMATVTSLDATHITAALKKHDGTPGTAQTVYWEAIV